MNSIRNLRRILALALAFVMVFSLMTFASAADEDSSFSPAAQVGNTYFETLQSAINAGIGDEVKVLKDLDLSDTGILIAEDKSVVLDLNGCSIEVSNTAEGLILVEGSLTLKDSSPAGKGVIFTEGPDASSKSVIRVDGGRFVMESGIINAAYSSDSVNNGAFAVGVFGDGQVVINGGKIVAGWYAIGSNNALTEATASITINGGTLISSADYAVFQAHNGTLNINGGLISGAAGAVCMHVGTLIATGGVFTSDGSGDTGAAIDGTGGLGNAVLNLTGSYGSVVAELKGGEYFTTGEPILFSIGKSDAVALTITGGCYSSNVVDYVPAAHQISIDTYVIGGRTYGYKVDAMLYDVIVSEIDNGFVIASMEQASIGDTVELCVVPDDGYALHSLSVTNAAGADVPVSIVGNTYSFTMPASAVTVSATYSPLATYIVTPLPGEYGTVSASVEATYAGDIVKLTAVPDTGYTFDSFSVKDGTGADILVVKSDGEYTFVMPASGVIVSASFSKLPANRIAIGTSNFGKISASVEEAAPGDVVELTIAPDAGYGISTLAVKDANRNYVTISEVDGKFSFVMPDTAVTVTASFARLSTHKINISKLENGKVKASKSTTFTDDTVELIVTPDEGYELSSLRVKDSANNEIKVVVQKGKYVFTMPSDAVTVSATFTKLSTYSITNHSSWDGSVRANKTNTYAGDLVELTVMPKAGYRLHTLAVKSISGAYVGVYEVDGTYMFEMPDCAVSVFAAFVEETPFKDISVSDWYYEAVAYVYENGLMVGTGNGDTFSPKLTVSRAMIMTILARMDGVDTSYGDPWYEVGMEWARFMGISDGTRPAEDITREEIVTMLYRYAYLNGYDVSDEGDMFMIMDADEISSWAEKAMSWAVGTGVIEGKGKGILDPQGTATRMEIAQMLMNFCENVIKPVG